MPTWPYYIFLKECDSHQRHPWPNNHHGQSQIVKLLGKLLFGSPSWSVHKLGGFSSWQIIVFERQSSEHIKWLWPKILSFCNYVNPNGGTQQLHHHPPLNGPTYSAEFLTVISLNLISVSLSLFNEDGSG